MSHYEGETRNTLERKGMTKIHVRREGMTKIHVRSDMKIGHLDEIIGVDYRNRKAQNKNLRSGRPPHLKMFWYPFDMSN
jgi:hypothetical protein